MEWIAERIVADRFRLLEKLGQGGMGSVWKAEHLALKSLVAIKQIDPSIASDASASARFLREAQSAAALRSTHVVQILDYGIDDGAPFIAMELMHGESLADRLQRLGRLSPGETSSIITQMARAVSRAHEAGIVHRDLKPDNVFIVPEVDHEVVKVLDFGIAKRTGGSNTLETENAKTKSGALLGTPYYMSPEQARGNRQVDHRADLWAMGVICYECLTGTRPFVSDGLGDLLMRICGEVPAPASSVVQMPPALDAWMSVALAKEPGQRFQSARELAEGLRAALEGAPAETGPAQPTPPTVSTEAVRLQSTTGGVAAVDVSTVPGRPRRGTATVWFAVVGLLAVVGAGTGGVWHLRASSAEPAGSADPARAAAALAVPSVASAPTSAPSLEPMASAPVVVPTVAPELVKDAGAPARGAKPRTEAASPPKARETSPTKAKPGGEELFPGRK